MMQKYRGEWLLLLATLTAAFGWLFSKNAIVELPAVAFIALRFSFATLLFLPFALPQLKSLNRQQWRYAVFVGLSFCLYLFFWVMGVKYTTELGKGAFLLSLAMLAAPLIAWGLYRQRPIRRFWFALPSAIIGMYLLANNGTEQSGFQLDTLFFLFTAFWAAVQFVLNSRYAQHLPVLALTTIQLSMVAISASIYSALFETFPSQISSPTWLWLTLSVLIGTNARFLLQTWGQKLSDLGNGALIMILEPVWTLLLSTLFMAENLSTTKIMGSTFVLSALLIYRLNVMRQK